MVSYARYASFVHFILLHQLFGFARRAAQVSAEFAECLDDCAKYHRRDGRDGQVLTTNRSQYSRKYPPHQHDRD